VKKIKISCGLWRASGMEFSDLKANILALLRGDEEFRYAVAGMLGLDEILKIIA